MEKQFRGRNKELNALEQKFNQNGFSMTVIFGRRRIGKTMLVNHFIQEKKCKCITFTSVEREERELLSMMTESVLDSLAPELKGNINFTSFDKLHVSAVTNRSK